MGYLQTLWAQILARAQADTGSGGLYEGSAWTLVTGVFNTFAPKEQAFPLVVFGVQSAVNLDTMGGGTGVAQGGAFREVDFFFNCYVDEAVSGANAHTKLANISRRIQGNWFLQSTGLPSYGYDRWTPTLSDTDGWVASMVQHVDSSEAHDEGILSQVERFKVYVSRAKATA